MSVIFDHDRPKRISLPESVLCEGKPPAVLAALVRDLQKKSQPILFTRLSADVFQRYLSPFSAILDYDDVSRTAILNGTCPRKKGTVAVVAAGSSDLFVAREACRTLDYLGFKQTLFADVGVAGLWRLTQRIKKINRHDVVIAIAGMDAALVSVLGGLTPRPVIAVPTSCGYGVAEKGRSALNSMLASCAPGVAVMNIDNGYGAACAAARILGGIRLSAKETRRAAAATAKKTPR